MGSLWKTEPREEDRRDGRSRFLDRSLAELQLGAPTQAIPVAPLPTGRLGPPACEWTTRLIASVSTTDRRLSNPAGGV